MYSVVREALALCKASLDRGHSTFFGVAMKYGFQFGILCRADTAL
jgi:hypothetical protein